MKQNSKLGSKTLPIIISSPDELLQLHGKKYVQFTCKCCYKLNIVEFRRERLDMFKELLCKECKTKNTCLNKYGVEFAHQDKDIIEKMKQTNIRIYGCECVSKNELVKSKIKQTNLSRYGKEFYTQTEEYVERSKQTCLMKYGVDNFTKTQDYKDKQKLTNLKKFGVEWASQSSIIQDKVNETLLERYGSTNRCHVKRFRYNNLLFDSSWELAFYIYNVDKGHNVIREPIYFEYKHNGKVHRYFPDFDVDGTLYEIKGDMFFDKDGRMISFRGTNDDGLLEAKRQCGISNGVVFLMEQDLNDCFEYIKMKYGKNYLEQFKIN